jgi:hypothetical protein
MRILFDLLLGQKVATTTTTIINITVVMVTLTPTAVPIKSRCHDPQSFLPLQIMVYPRNTNSMPAATIIVLHHLSTMTQQYGAAQYHQEREAMSVFDPTRATRIKKLALPLEAYEKLPVD